MPEARFLRPLRLPVSPRGHDPRFEGAGRGDRTHLNRLVEPVLSPESEPRADLWGSRESNTERAPYQRAQVTVPSYPETKKTSRAGRGSRTHTVLLLRQLPPAIGLRRRYGTRGSNPARAVCGTAAFSSSLVPLGLGGGIRTPGLRHPEPALYQVEPHPDETVTLRRIKRRTVWVGGFEPPVFGSRSRRSTRLSHTQMVATEGIEPSRSAL